MNTMRRSQEELSLLLDLNEDSIYIGQEVLEALGEPRQIQMMINPEQKKILIQACTIEDRNAIVVPPQPMLFFEMSGQSLLKRIRKLTEWPDDHPRFLYGQRVPGYTAIVFDLMTAEIADSTLPSMLQEMEAIAKRDRDKNINRNNHS